MMFHAPPVQVPPPAWAPPNVPVVVTALPKGASPNHLIIRKSLERSIPLFAILPNWQGGALAAIPPVLVPRESILDRSHLIAIDSVKRRPVDVPRPVSPILLLNQAPTFTALPEVARLEIESQKRRPVDVPQPLTLGNLIAQTPKNAFGLVTPDQWTALKSQDRRRVEVPQPLNLEAFKVNPPTLLFRPDDFIAIASQRFRSVVVPSPAMAPPIGQAAEYLGQFALATPGVYAALGGISSFARADATTCATYHDVNGVLQTVAANVLRDSHYVLGKRTILLEPTRLNGYVQSQFATGWTRNDAGMAFTQAATTGPDGVAGSAVKIVESTGVGVVQTIFQTAGSNASDNLTQAFAVYVKAGERTWCLLRTANKAGSNPFSWFNLSTGLPGTIDPTHTLIVAAMANGWYRLTLLVNSASGGSTFRFFVGMALSNGTTGYTGDGVSGLYLFGGQFEKDAPLATSYIATGASTVTRAVDALALAGSSLNGTLYEAFYDETTQTLKSTVQAYIANTLITPPTCAAYTQIAVLKSRGVLTAAQAAAALAGSATGFGGGTDRRRRRG